MRKIPSIILTITALLLSAGTATAGSSPFAEFDLQVFDLVLKNGAPSSDQCLLGGRLRLSEGSDGLLPLMEEVTLRVGSFAATIPAGSFSVAGSEYSWHGNLDGAVVGVIFEEEAADTYTFAIAVGSIELGGLSDPMTVRLNIGDDGGAMSARLEGRLVLAGRQAPGKSIDEPDGGGVQYSRRTMSP